MDKFLLTQTDFRQTMSFQVGEKVEFRDSQMNIYQGVVKSVSGNFYEVSDVTAQKPRGDVWIKQDLCYEAKQDNSVSFIEETESREEQIRRIVKEEISKND